MERKPSYNPPALKEPRDGPKKAKMNRRTTFLLKLINCVNIYGLKIEKFCTELSCFWR